MSFNKWDHHVMSPPVLAPKDSVVDRRAAAAARVAEEVDRRQAELVQLRSQTNSVSARVRLWEARYGLALPMDPGHPLLECVAQATHLTLAEVRREQRERLAIG
jgi:hypothetical protein